MIVRFLLVITLLLNLGCSRDISIDGFWNLSIQLQDKTLPAIIYLKVGKNKELLSGHLVNGGEELELEGVIDKKGSFELSIAAHYAKFVGTYKNNSLKGRWIRTNKKDYTVAFTGARSSKKSLFQSYESEISNLNLTGQWKIDLGEGKFGLGNFVQKGNRLQGSILTKTGDYRYLDGYLSNYDIHLFGFDGVFSFVLKGTFLKGTLLATMYSGKDSVKKISGQKDDKFHLENPLTLTQLTNTSPLKLKMKSIDDTMIDLDSDEFKSKVKIVQVFGSWCPNCHDETNYFVKWRSKNKEKLDQVKFVALSFERGDSKAEALKNLRRVRSKLKMDYDIILADFDKTVKVTDILPLDKTVAFPTTLFVNKNNEIVKIHTGFSGQATGEYFKKFTKDFDKTINDLLL